MKLIMKLRKYVLFFIIYSIVGWCYEVFLEVCIYHIGFSNRGVLFGPYTPVYGIGALIFITAIYPLIKEKKSIERIMYVVPVFLGCLIIATVLELGTTYIMEWVVGSWPWQTYTRYEYNFQGRIALSPSVRFGIGGIFFLYILQPIFEGVVNRISERGLTAISIIIMSILTIDLVYTLLVN